MDAIYTLSHKCIWSTGLQPHDHSENSQRHPTQGTLYPIPLLTGYIAPDEVLETETTPGRECIPLMNGYSHPELVTTTWWRQVVMWPIYEWIHSWDWAITSWHCATLPDSPWRYVIVMERIHWLIRPIVKRANQSGTFSQSHVVLSHGSCDPVT